MHYEWNQYLSESQFAELNSKGYFTELVDEEKRKYVVIDNSMLLDFEKIDGKQLLENVKCPVLIIHGDNDEEERALYKTSKKVVQYLENSEIIVINGANHSFLNHHDKLIEAAKKWFIKTLK